MTAGNTGTYFVGRDGLRLIAELQMIRERPIFALNSNNERSNMSHFLALTIFVCSLTCDSNFSSAHEPETRSIRGHSARSCRSFRRAVTGLCFPTKERSGGWLAMAAR